MQEINNKKLGLIPQKINYKRNFKIFETNENKNNIPNFMGCGLYILC